MGADPGIFKTLSKFGTSFTLQKYIFCPPPLVNPSLDPSLLCLQLMYSTAAAAATATAPKSVGF